MLRLFLIGNLGGNNMEKRTFGRTGHQSTVAIFGAAAFWDITQRLTDTVLNQVLNAGVNHFDVAPSYGVAEERIAPWMPRIRQQIFLGCKTMERSQQGSWAEMQQSRKRLNIDNFDLYQIHAITTFEELDEATKPDGVLATLDKMKKEGLTDYVGITGHGMQSPQIFLEALNRYDFDSVLFPLNFALYARPNYLEASEKLLQICQERNVGTMIIKSIAKGPWKDQPQTHITWYQPFSEQELIQQCVNFALSQPVTGICTVGDITVLPMVLNACQNFTPLSAEEQNELIRQGEKMEMFF